jgi:zinc protease
VVGESGLKKLSRVQLNKLLAGKQASVFLGLGDQYEQLSGGSTPKDLETMLQLAYLQFSQVNFDPAVFESFISKQKQFLPNLIANPQTYFSDEVGKIMTQNHPRSYPFPTVEDLNRIKLDDIKAVYADRFGDASDFTFVFVGNFEPEKIKPLIVKYLGNLPNKKRVEAWKDLGIRAPTGLVEKTIKKGVDQKSLVQMTFTAPMKYDRNEATAIQALGELLSIKLVEILREEKSGVYGVGASGGMIKVPYERYLFNISFPAGPENVTSLIDATIAEIKKVQSGQIEDKDVDKIKEARRVRIREDLKRNEYWASVLTRNLQEGWDIYSAEEWEARINAITKENIQAAAKKYLRLDERKQFILLPESAVSK